MRWYRAAAIKREQTGTDELHNPVCSEVSAFDFFVRVGPWHKVKADNAGNAYDGVTRSLLTKRPAADFGGMCAVEVKGHAYELASVSADGDTTVLTVKGFKPWVL